MAGDTLIVRWVDRLGLNYQDVCDTIREFMRRGVAVRTVINNMIFDGATTDPIQMAVRDAVIGFMAATAQRPKRRRRRPHRWQGSTMRGNRKTGATWAESRDSRASRWRTCGRCWSRAQVSP